MYPFWFIRSKATDIRHTIFVYIEKFKTGLFIYAFSVRELEML